VPHSACESMHNHIRRSNRGSHPPRHRVTKHPPTAGSRPEAGAVRGSAGGSDSVAAGPGSYGGTERLSCKSAGSGGIGTPSQAVQPETKPDRPSKDRVKRDHRRPQPDPPRTVRPLPGWATTPPPNKPETDRSGPPQTGSRIAAEVVSQPTGNSRRNRPRHRSAERGTRPRRRLLPVTRDTTPPNPPRARPPAPELGPPSVRASDTNRGPGSRNTLSEAPT
jgi:hypothetical protein